MEILYLLIPLSVVLAFLIGGIFWWSVRGGQFDDLEGPAHRILDDDDKSPLPGPLLREEREKSQERRGGLTADPERRDDPKGNAQELKMKVDG